MISTLIYAIVDKDGSFLGKSCKFYPDFTRASLYSKLSSARQVLTYLLRYNTHMYTTIEGIKIICLEIREAGDATHIHPSNPTLVIRK